jgi:hypothetical protein
VQAGRYGSLDSNAGRSNNEGFDVVLTRNGEISVVDDRGREIESHVVPTGAKLAGPMAMWSKTAKFFAIGTRTRFP